MKPLPNDSRGHRLRRRRNLEPTGRGERRLDSRARGQRLEGAGDDARDGGLPRREPRDDAELEGREHDAEERGRRADGVRARWVRHGRSVHEPDVPELLHAPFAQHPFWVTKYKDGELYAAGDYPYEGAAGDGLTAYASPAENVDGKDVVTWYAVAPTHVPHVEDYPVMTTESARFQIVPDGFFDSDPALDAPGQ